MLSVGIHENVRLAGVQIEKSKDDKPYLALSFEQGDITEPKEGPVDVLDEFNSTDNTSGSGNSTKISLWGASTEIMNKPVAAEDVKKAVKVKKDQLTQILMGYVTASEIRWNLFEGFPPMPEDQSAAKEIVGKIFVTQREVDKIDANLNRQFIEMYTKADSSKQFRLKFVRTSKAKNYPALPKFGEFWEDMIIPENKTKVRFTPWEIKEGYDRDDAVKAESNVASTTTDIYGGL